MKESTLTLKSNHPTLHSQVQNWFEVAKAKNFEGITVSHDRRVEKGHHRREKRLVWAPINLDKSGQPYAGGRLNGRILVEYL